MISTKLCSKCKIEQPISNFSKNKHMKDGFCNWCKECYRERGREYYKKNKDKIQKAHKKYYEQNKEKVKKMQAEWYQKNKEIVQEKHRKYHREHLEERRAYEREYRSRPEVKAHIREYNLANRDARREYEKEYRAKNRERIRKKQNEHYHKNKERHQEWHKKWRESHKEQIRESSKRYREENREKMNRSKLDKLHSDPIFKLSEQYRNRVQLALKAKEHHKASKTAEMLGCDLYFFKDYMLATWEKRYGKPWAGEEYNVDHIIPLMSAQTEDDVKRLFHHTNLQLLAPEDNMRKREEDKKKYGASI